MSLSGESYGQRSLVGHGPWDYKKSDMTELNTAYTYALEQVHLYLSLGLFNLLPKSIIPFTYWSGCVFTHLSGLFTLGMFSLKDLRRLILPNVGVSLGFYSCAPSVFLNIHLYLAILFLFSV